MLLVLHHLWDGKIASAFNLLFTDESIAANSSIDLKEFYFQLLSEEPYKDSSNDSNSVNNIDVIYPQRTCAEYMSNRLYGDGYMGQYQDNYVDGDDTGENSGEKLEKKTPQYCHHLLHGASRFDSTAIGKNDLGALLIAELTCKIFE